MANRRMKMGGKAKVKEPAPHAVYKKRMAKPEPDRVPMAPKKRRFGPPKGFI